MINARLPAIEIETKPHPTHAVIWLHGLGADGGDFAPFVPELNLPATFAIRFIFPHAPIRPITINNGYEMRGWYDITSLGRHGDTDEAGIIESIASIEGLIAEEINRGIPAQNIILGGFSQGCVMALRTGLQYKETLAGIVALSGYLPLTQPLPKSSPSTPIFLAHGIEDNVLPFFLGQMAHQVLEEAGYKIDWHCYPIAHTVSDAELKDISQWMQKRFS